VYSLVFRTWDHRAPARYWLLGLSNAPDTMAETILGLAKKGIFRNVCDSRGWNFLFLRKKCVSFGCFKKYRQPWDRRTPVRALGCLISFSVSNADPKQSRSALEIIGNVNHPIGNWFVCTKLLTTDQIKDYIYDTY
jgi:hypothetical protein